MCIVARAFDALLADVRFGSGALYFSVPATTCITGKLPARDGAVGVVCMAILLSPAGGTDVLALFGRAAVLHDFALVQDAAWR